MHYLLHLGTTPDMYVIVYKGFPHANRHSDTKSKVCVLVGIKNIVDISRHHGRHVGREGLWPSCLEGKDSSSSRSGFRYLG